ncbi:MAG: bifunctional UDP-N-acetylglucosamine diphosphorylase/glucosamine-1-phosphate N-acetyltransferase GlmU [Thermodesulfobacteriota bacterium]
MKNQTAIVLAAGKGTRMKSELPKVLHEVAGQPMILHVIKLLKGLGIGRIIVVVGHGGDEVRERLRGYDLTFVEQPEQLGTGHAVLTAMRVLKGYSGDVLILSGDVPLLKAPTIRGLFKLYKKEGPARALAFISALMEDPAGYGRVLRDARGNVTRIAEHKDATRAEKAVKEINTGCYLAHAGFLAKNIKKIGSSNAQAEYYLPDLIPLALKGGGKVSALTLDDPSEVMGINNRVELAGAGAIMRKRVLKNLMQSGVTIIDPERTIINADVKVGRDTIIHPAVSISGSTIGRGCIIEQGAIISGSTIGPQTTVKAYSVIESSRIGRSVSIGPFARLRPEVRVADEVRLGNFVEVKKTSLGKGARAGHLSYLGDSRIGAGVNIGAGTITCNYDGVKKYLTRIDAGAFIGSDSQLVAPVHVGKGAYVGSGTTVTRDVPPGALATSRGAEKITKGWVKKKFGK